MISPPPSILVFGPAYLDRVLRVDRPLLDPALGLPPLDRSVNGRWAARGGPRLALADSTGASILIAPPAGWPGGLGTVALDRPFADDLGLAPPRQLVGTSWGDDLGGMGAGFAASLGGTLVSALGPADDPASRAVAALLARAGIAHEPIRVAGHPADWTLLITSGPHGDKLPVGFRGCHAAWGDPGPHANHPARVRVVAGLPNRLARRALGEPAAGTIRAFFPAARNMQDRADPLAGFADRFDLLSCNRGEWDDLGPAAALDRVPIRAITDGPRGAVVCFHSPDGPPAQVEIPAFPLPTPIIDTNRAGEAFAATLLQTLLDASWTPGPTPTDLIRHAARRAAGAAALTIRRADFGFPTPAEIDAALRPTSQAPPTPV